MRLKRLIFKGFGPYSDEQSITFPTNSKKVIINGTNGAGKSFLLDTVPAALFKTVPNREGSFYDQFHGNDALVDLTFEYAGHEYRIRRLINAVSRTQKCYLLRDGETLTEGKGKEFEEQVAQLGLDRNTFLAAVYQTQTGKGSAMSMDTNDRIQLLSAILNLLDFDEKHEKSIKAVREQKRLIDELNTRRQTLVETLSNVDALNQDLAATQEKLKALSETEKALDLEYEQAVQSVANAQANAGNLADIKREIKNLEAEINADKETAENREIRIKNNQELVVDRADEIREAVKNTELRREMAATAQKIIAENRQKVDEWEAGHRQRVVTKTQEWEGFIARRKVLEDERAAQDKNLAGFKNDKISATNDLARIKKATEILSRVPCSGMDIEKQCELLKQAHAEAARIPDVEEDLKRAEENIPKLESIIQNVMTQIIVIDSSVNQAKADLEALQKKQAPPQFSEAIKEYTEGIAASEDLIKQWESLVKLAPQLEGAEQRVADLQAELKVISERSVRNNQALTEKKAKLEQAADVENTITSAEVKKQEVNRKRQETEGRINTENHRLGLITHQILKAEETKVAIDSIEVDLLKAGNHLAELELLREALGPKGAKNLKIDAAGKAITERANRLIRVALGPQFSLVINTLKELKTKDENGELEVRETLDFKVIDNETGEEKFMENLSGGEKAMVGLVFSLSLAIEQAESTNADYKTLILDEPSAGLSEENSIRYLEMLDVALAETGLEQIFIISHMPAMKSLCDSVINVTKASDGESAQVEVLN